MRIGPLTRYDPPPKCLCGGVQTKVAETLTLFVAFSQSDRRPTLTPPKSVRAVRSCIGPQRTLSAVGLSNSEVLTCSRSIWRWYGSQRSAAGRIVLPSKEEGQHPVEFRVDRGSSAALVRCCGITFVLASHRPRPNLHG